MRETSQLNQIKCLVGEPCIYCQPLQCPRTFSNHKFDPDHSCSDDSFFGKNSIPLSILLLFIGFVLGILYQRRNDVSAASRSNQVAKICCTAPVTICELGVQTVSDKTSRSQFSDLSEELLFNPPPPSISDGLDKEECENSDEAEEEEETAKLRWRDVRLTRRGSLFATR